MLPAAYFLYPTAVHTATENWKPQFVLLTEKGVGGFSTVYSIPPTSLLGMWFRQEKLGTGTRSWPPCLTHWSAVHSPLKTPDNLALLLPHWLLSIPFFFRVWIWPCGTKTDSSKAQQSLQGQAAWGQHPGRDVFHTDHGRELETAAQAAAENWAQPTAVWSLFGWTSFYDLLVPAFRCLQAGGKGNVGVCELSLANRLCFPNTKGMGTATFPVVNTLLWVKHLLFCMLLL